MNITKTEKLQLVLILCIASVKEICFWLFPEQILLNTVLKLFAGVAIFLVCRVRKPVFRRDWLILIAAVLFIIADLLIKWQFLVSGALFFLGHLLLIIYFCLNKKPTARGLIIWGVLTAAEAPFMIWLLTKHGFSFLTGCLGAMYGSMLVLMVVCALRQNKLMASAALLFVFSDLFLALHKAFTVLQWMHAPSILLFYLSIGMILLNVRKEEAGRDISKEDGQ